MKETALAFVVVGIFITGVIIGYCIPHEFKAMWNLWDDPRGCIIAWDDGTFSYKSPIRKLGTIKPGEKKKFYLLGQTETEEYIKQNCVPNFEENNMNEEEFTELDGTGVKFGICYRDDCPPAPDDDNLHFCPGHEDDYIGGNAEKTWHIRRKGNILCEAKPETNNFTKSLGENARICQECSKLAEENP